MRTLPQTKKPYSTEPKRPARSTEMKRETKRTAGSSKAGADLDVLGLYLSRARRHRILTRQEEADLAARISQGDEDAFEELVRCNLRLVVSIARRYVGGQGLEFVDLVQEGNLGLMRAARGFDASFGTKFSTYATWWIKQSIGRAISNKASLVRLPVHAAEEERLLSGARKRLRAVTGREPSVGELSGYVGKSEREVTEALAARKTVVSYDVAVGPEEDGSLSDLLPDETEADTEDLLMEDALKNSIHELLAKLPERERYVVERRYGLGGGECATLGEIGQEAGVTRERVRQIQNAALRKLRSLALEVELESFLEQSLSPRRISWDNVREVLSD
jgi:RNA polymerase primary sigma factor